jgi:muramoyltetrapeptide carboxypeptidase
MLDFNLQQGDTIGVVCPSGPLSEDLQTLIYQGLTDLGYEVKLCLNYREKALYLAGDDSVRLHAFLDVWLDPKVKVVWAARGGYGSCRLLENLPFNLLKNNFKPFIGMSDITALHLGFSKFKFPFSILGPTLSYLFSDKTSKEQTTMREEIFSLLSSRVSWSEYLNFFFHKPEIIKGGVARAPIIGGNLSVLVSLIGTRWELKGKGKILLLEDINEPLYKIDRMLFQCDKSGLFNDLDGVILSSFQNTIEASLSDLQTLFSSYFSKRDYPIVFGANSGHLSYQTMIPLNKTVTLIAENEVKVEL